MNLIFVFRQARERVTKKELIQMRAELDAERAMNGKAKLDMEKQVGNKVQPTSRVGPTNLEFFYIFCKCP